MLFFGFWRLRVTFGDSFDRWAFFHFRFFEKLAAICVAKMPTRETFESAEPS
jgi:hypothetical protein